MVFEYRARGFFFQSVGDRQHLDAGSGDRERIECGPFGVSATVYREQPVRRQNRVFGVRKRKYGSVFSDARRNARETLRGMPASDRLVARRENAINIRRQSLSGQSS